MCRNILRTYKSLNLNTVKETSILKPNNEDIVKLFIRNSNTLIPLLFKYYPFTHELINKHQDMAEWDKLSANKNINWTDNFIDKHAAKWEWYRTMCMNPSLPWSIAFIEKHLGKFGSKEEMSGNKGMPWSYEFINHFKDRWNWHWLTINKSINWDQKMFVDFEMWNKTIQHVNGDNLWTEEFIIKYKNNFNW